MPGRTRSTRDDASGRHILLLDDEEAILLPTARYFRGLGCAVDIARTREEADLLLGHRRYDLAILDLRITGFGGAGGIEVLREIRRREHATRVIVLSGYISPEVEAEARALGADSVLAKPQPLPALAQIGFALLRAVRG
jgi:two-component system response regulator RegA